MGLTRDIGENVIDIAYLDHDGEACKAPVDKWILHSYQVRPFDQRIEGMVLQGYTCGDGIDVHQRPSWSQHFVIYPTQYAALVNALPSNAIADLTATFLLDWITENDIINIKNQGEV